MKIALIIIATVLAWNFVWAACDKDDETVELDDNQAEILRDELIRKQEEDNDLD